MKGFNITVANDGIIHVNDGKITMQFPNSYINKTILDFMYEIGEAYKEMNSLKEIKQEEAKKIDSMIECGRINKSSLEYAGKIMGILNITEYSLLSDPFEKDNVLLYIKGDEDLVTRFWVNWELYMGE